MSNRVDTTGLSEFEAYRIAFDAHPTVVRDWERPACKQGWMDADTAKREWMASRGEAAA